MASVLVGYGTKMGGTVAIAERIGEVLTLAGHDVTVADASKVRKVDGYDAAVVGSGLYAGMWRRPAKGLVRGIGKAAPGLPLWLFHSGPLGDEEADEPQAFPKWLRELEPQLNVRDKVTFGGVLDENAKGFIAKSMRKNGMGGDWRDMEAIGRWAERIAAELG
jgi:menaquinone-dependent protoporphyrinogen oxidase